MINAFKLAAVINESAALPSVRSVDAYPFMTESFQECALAANSILMSEAASVAQYRATLDEIMVEAAINSPDRIGALSEASIANAWDALKKFLDKCRAVVKGLIEKLKAFVFKMTRKTTEWAKIMEPRIEKATNNVNGISNFKMEIRKWNPDYVCNKLYDGFNSITGEALANLEKDGSPDKVAEFVSSQVKNVSDNKDQTEEQLSGEGGYYELMDQKLEQYKKDLEDAKEGFISNLAGKLGINASSTEELFAEIDKNAHGDKETLGADAFGGVKSMLTIIKEHANRVKKMEDAYKKLETSLAKASKAVDTASAKASKMGKDLDKAPTNLKGKASEIIRVYTSKVTYNVNACQTVINTVSGKNTTYAKEMVTDFMTFLTRYAGYKGSKD